MLEFAARCRVLRRIMQSWAVLHECHDHHKQTWQRFVLPSYHLHFQDCCCRAFAILEIHILVAPDVYSYRAGSDTSLEGVQEDYVPRSRRLASGGPKSSQQGP